MLAQRYGVTIVGRWAGFSMPAAPVAVLTFVGLSIAYTLVVAGRPRAWAKGAAGAAVIMNDDAKVAGEGLDLGGPERAEAGEAGHEEERGALAALLVVEVAVAQGDGGHGASARGVVHAQRALDGHDVLRPLEGRGSGRPRLARPPDGLEELLEARRRHHPEHHELVF